MIETRKCAEREADLHYSNRKQLHSFEYNNLVTKVSKEYKPKIFAQELGFLKVICCHFFIVMFLI